MPFVGDAVGLNANPNWEKVKAKQDDVITLNMVDSVFKLNRANAKVGVSLTIIGRSIRSISLS